MTPSQNRILGFLFWGIVVLYTETYLLWYGTTALGLVPQLDAKENILLAQAMAGGQLPAEPFYRAPLYASVLSLFARLGVAGVTLPMAARLLNGCLHLANTVLVYRLGRGLWNSRGAAFVAAALVGLNPVCIYFAADPLDTTLANTLMLAGLAVAMPLLGDDGRSRTGIVRAATTQGFWCLAALARPHLMVLAVLWPAVCWLFLRRRRPVVGALIVFVCVFAVFGLVNHKVGGRFQIMPTQGGYDLWTANRPGAHGKYFAHSVDVLTEDTYQNPARAEARLIYERETNTSAGDREIQQYWRARTRAMILDNPAAWIGRVWRKTIYLFNNTEQYNNKTYAVHKARSALLRYNPLGWTAILALALGAACMHARDSRVRLILLLALGYGAGVLLYYVSARFRMPLVPLGAILAGGWATAAGGQVKHRRMGVTVLLITCALSFPPWPGVREPATAIEDDILLARASIDAGMYREGLEHATRAYGVAPTRKSVRELKCIAYFNLFQKDRDTYGDIVRIRSELDACSTIEMYSGSVRYIAGVYAWVLGRPEAATRRWVDLIDAESPQAVHALTALSLAGRLRATDRDRLQTTDLEAMPGPLLIAQFLNGNAAAWQVLAKRLPADMLQVEIDRYRRLLLPLPE